MKSIEQTSPSVNGRHHISRVRHDTRRRTLTVTRTTTLTPQMLRVEFTSPELADFHSAAPDDHIKLFLPGRDGEACARDYTPRAFDPSEQTLTIDFLLHDAGPATSWAMRAAVGDELQIGGPRGSVVVPDDFDWYVLIADGTGLPALGRWLETLRPGASVVTACLVDGPAEVQAISTRAAWTPHWVYRSRSAEDDATALERVVESRTLPAGDGYVWIAAEAMVARRLRTYFITKRDHPPHWMRAAGYWLRGEPGVHQNLD